MAIVFKESKGEVGLRFKGTIMESNNPKSSTPKPIVKQRSFLFPLIGGLAALLILAGGAYYFVKSKPLITSPQTQSITPITQPSSTPEDVTANWKATNISDISPSKNRTIPADIQKTLPTKSSDGKDIKAYYISDNQNYIVFGTYVKERGAGKEYEWWLLNLSTGEQKNLSKLLKDNVYYKDYYKDNTYYNTLFLAFNDRWVDNSPEFSIVDGWREASVGDGPYQASFFWLYDVNQNKFFSNKEK